MSMLTYYAPIVNFDVPIIADEPRPTAGPDFVPSDADHVEAAHLLNSHGDDFLGEDERAMEALTIPDFDYFAELAHEAERIAAGPML